MNRYPSTRGDLPHIEYRFGASESDPRVQESLEILMNVPEIMHRVIRAYGGRIVFFNGPLTDNPEFETWGGFKVPYNEYTWDEQPAVHHEPSKTSLVGVRGPYRFWDPRNAVHEEGHCFDYRTGELFYGRRRIGPGYSCIPKISTTRQFLELMRIYTDIESRAKEILPGIPLALENDPGEWFAHSFECHFDPSNETHRRIYPHFTEFFDELEERIELKIQ